MDYASLLNEAQLRPVVDTDGAVLVLAGAGSGKTRVLTYRIAYLIEHNHVAPYNILAITFTNKAAGEMRERVRSVTGQGGVFIATFHSFCAQILRTDIDKLGYKSNFSIYDDSDSNHVIARIFKSYDIEDTKELKKTVRWHISNAKNHALSPSEYAKKIYGQNHFDTITKVYSAYEAELKANNALDFDDLLLKTIVLFTERADVLAKYQQRFEYIHVDEFQDTNKIQYMLIRLLSAKFGNVFVVGDDDQSIYGWRWAEVENIKRFTQNFAGCRIYKLEQNYRSTGNILNLANKIIANNTGRMGKELWTSGASGVNIVYRSCYNEKTEAEFVLEEINSLVKYNNYNYGDFAILVRANSISRPFEEKLALYNFPYKVIGGNKFYDRKEIKDFLAYLKIVANPIDNESILRVINVPKRGIGDGAIEKLVEACSNKKMTLIDGILQIDKLGLPNAACRNISKFSAIIYELMSKKDEPLESFIDTCKTAIDFGSMYDMDNDEDANRLANIDDFVASVKEFCGDNKDCKIDEYLQSVSLISDNDKVDNAESITLATVHGVKGLEYRCVFIVGLEDGIFPSIRKDASDDDMLEERRIMYVAITRAKERLYLTNAQSRFRYGKREDSLASRFLTEGDLVRKIEPQRVSDAPQRSFNFEKSQISTPPFAQNNYNSAQPASKNTSKFKEGMTVVHARFGNGKIIEITGENAKISFETLGVKTFNLRLAPIDIVE
ncbi:MAG: UvrD-helicase domain-containing protein [Clostridia bacterium]